ncbi:family 78 glycoside hydrolase catalytic domain [Agromyces sp. GXS1127]|uniref:family 78 glycoside hydrolase catalytic domain n=1 Tax=Agromyces sp. GXS1127 TaxID=3424181 RepID=UPI003D31B7E5
MTLTPTVALAAPHAAVTHLTTEHRVAPINVDVESPRFGWNITSTERNQRQTAYRIVVATSEAGLSNGRGVVWDTGKVASDRQIAVEYEGEALEPSTAYFWKVDVWDANGRLIRPGSEVASFETALLSDDGETNWDGAEWISMADKEPNSPGMPMFRTDVDLAKPAVQDARLYISSLGVYDAYINGERVSVPQGDGETVELLTPGWTNYDVKVNYMTYDVTDMVRAAKQDGGELAVGAVLGNGWFNSSISNGANYYSRNGNPLALKAKLLVEYANGTTESIVTEAGDQWRATDTGPYRFDGVYDGQDYDATMEIPGWSEADFDDSGWAGTVESPYESTFPDAVLTAYPGETARIMDEMSPQPVSLSVHTGVTNEESSPNGRGEVVVDESRSVSGDAAADAEVTLAHGETAVYDLGQNMVGVPKFTVSGDEGTAIRLRFSEFLNDDSEGADGPEGSVYLENLRGARATTNYILSGDGMETHQDSLSFYGFQYVEVTVMTEGAEVTVHDVQGKVGTSAITDIGRVTTDDQYINKLFENTRWGQRGNYLWIPTDCPQRNERQGWTADTQVFANTALYNGDSSWFLSHFMDSFIDTTELYGPDGAQFTSVSPGAAFSFLSQRGISGWSDAGVVIPWTLWQMTGDDTIIDDSWGAMEKYLDWIHEQTGDSWAGQGAVFGDWLSFQHTSNQLTSDYYYAYSTSLMSQMATATGRTAEAAKYDDWFANQKQAFLDKYVVDDPVAGVRILSSLPTSGFALTNGGIPEDDTQTALLWALKLGFYEDDEQRDQMIQLLADNINATDEFVANHGPQGTQTIETTRADYAPDTISVGFLGANIINPVLTDVGRGDLAYTLLHQDEMPSWLYSVKNGATTIWERWNSYSIEDGFGPASMNSFNHYAYGAIVEWMYEDMAGISKDTANPGFKHFFLQPHIDPTGEITEVEGEYRSPYGDITSAWSVDGDAFSYEFDIPAGTTATVRVPAASADVVNVDADVDVEFMDGVAEFMLGSGSYSVTSTLG